MSKALSSVEPLLGRFFMMKLAVVVVVVVRTGNGTSLGFDLSVSSGAGAKLRCLRGVPGHPCRNENSVLIIKFSLHKSES